MIVDYFKGSGSSDAFESYQELGRFVDMVKNQICGEMGICGIGAAQATINGRVADSAKIGRNASTIALIQDKTPEEVDAVLAQRRAAWKPKEPKYPSGVLKFFAQHAISPMAGGYMD